MIRTSKCSNLVAYIGKSFAISSLFLVLNFFTISDTYATHAMGMDLTYQEVGKDSFLVKLAFYRDCAGVAAPANTPIRVKSVLCNFDFNVTLPRVGSGQETTPVCTSLVTKCNGGTFPGSEEYIYQKIIVLPAQCTDWTISNFICCRNNAITTINSPGSQNIFVEAKINNFYSNSSPNFSNPPVPFVCANQTYCFNNGAIDAEGDSLVYSLITPRTGINATNTVTFKAGFSKFNPLTSSPQISLDSITGDLCMFPTDSNEIAVLAVLVQEYRNGVLISSIMRDIQLRIIGCPNGNNQPTSSGINNTSNYSTKICANSNLNFQVFSIDADSGQTVTMSWNQAITGATFNISGGSRPVGTFSWTPTINEVRSQPYCFTVTVSDDNCPFNGSQVFSYCISVVGVASIVDSLRDPTCAGSCDGQAAVRVINGIPPFSYLWNDPSLQTTSTAKGLCQGNYIAIGIDSTGCTTSTPIVITDPKPMALDMDSVEVSCFGGNDGKAVVAAITSGTPPYTYQWEVNAGLQTSDTAINLLSGEYAVTVTDSNNCTATDSVVVTEPAKLTLNMVVVAHVSCNGNSDGIAAVQANGGVQPYTYLWSVFSSSQTTDTAFNLLAGNHSVTVTDAYGCQNTGNVVITEPATAITLTLTKSDITCSGDSSGQATVTPSGGTPPYFYNWDAGTGNQTTQTAVNLPAGIYSVIVTDTNNCVAFPNIVISEPLNPITVTPVDSFVACNGDNNGVAGIQISGGTTPYSFLWDAAAGSQTTQYASGLGAGTYKVLVTDSLNCTDSATVQLLEALTPLAIIVDQDDVSCNNGSDGLAVVTVSGGQPSYSIQWDAGTGAQTGDSAFNLIAGTYFVSIVDSFGCNIDTSVIITQPPPLLTLLTNSTNVSCFGDSNGTASVVVSGGTPPYQYLWSANAGGQTTDTATGLKAGTFFVTVYDSNYCITSPGIVVNEPVADLSATISAQDANCFNTSDGLAFAQGLGGTPPYTYQWDVAAASQTTDTAFNLSAGTYGVTIVDSFFCAFDTFIAVSQPNAPLQLNTSSTPASCFGGSNGEAYVSANGGTAPYQFTWAASAGSQTNDTAVNLSAGYHVVSVLDDNNCGVTDSALIGGPAEPVVILTTAFDTKCFESSDGFAIAEASGGTSPYIYLWDANTGSQLNDTAFNLGKGIYAVTATDSNGCDTTFSVFIDEPSQLIDSLFISSNFNGSAIKCFGDSNGTLTATASGGTPPYRFQWDASANSQTTATAIDIHEGNYSVIITDTNDCTVQGFIGIGSPQKMGFTVNEVKHVNCNAGNDGRVSVSGIGGTKPFSYLWNTTPAVTDSILDSVIVGSYTVTITDINGCVHDTTLVVTEPTILNITSLTFTDARCFNESSGNASVVVSGGTLPYSYLWQISPGIFQITSTAVNLAAGTYPLSVKDAKNCKILDTVIINEPTQETVSTSRNDTVCALDPVILQANGSGGDSSAYNYIWLPPRPDSLPNQSVNPAATTNYSVRAMDAKGCLSFPSLITIFVRTMDEDTMRVSSAGNVCEGDTSSVFGLHNGPFGNYTYLWKHGKTGLGPHQVIPDTSTYYILTVGDICSNSLTDSVLVKVFPNPEFYLDSLLAQGCEPLDVQFDDTVNTMSNLSYSWSFGDGNGSNQKNPVYTYLSAGTYNVSLTITTENSCTASNKSKPSLVIVYPNPVTDFKANPVVTDMRNPDVVFTNLSSGAVIYNWVFGDGDTSSLTSPEHIFGDTGTYTVVLTSTSDKGCISTSTLDIVVKPYYYLDIPNAFTPSSSSGGGNWRSDPDGNLVFFPYTTHPEAVNQYEMIIFNRWGELIFETTNIYLGWDGTYKGKPSPQEVYVYKVKLTFDNGQNFEKMGDVTLFR